jgi:adenylosuccinate synthase
VDKVPDLRRMADLPSEARNYLARISQLIGRPVEIASVGPDREQTVLG